MDVVNWASEEHNKKNPSLFVTYCSDTMVVSSQVSRTLILLLHIITGWVWGCSGRKIQRENLFTTIITGEDRSTYSLSFTRSPVSCGCAARGTVGPLTCVFPAQFPARPWRTRAPQLLNRGQKLSSCSRHLHGVCDLGETTEGYRWGFWSLLAVTYLTSLSISRHSNPRQQISLNTKNGSFEAQLN